MIRIHLTRQYQFSHCDVEQQGKSIDIDIPELEQLLSAQEGEGVNGYGSRWGFSGVEVLCAK